MNLLANNIRYYRKKLKLSQEKLAELADLHPTYISNIEQGKRNLSLQTVSDIADAFQIPITTLLSKTQE
ncbi:MAG: helix-turn-helix transcriptional regulator [Clostridium sp.]|nr:helix-turn-helix transcriptional regulator [Clostridium sp.]